MALSTSRDRSRAGHCGVRCAYGHGARRHSPDLHFDLLTLCAASTICMHACQADSELEDKARIMQLGGDRGYAASN